MQSTFEVDDTTARASCWAAMSLRKNGYIMIFNEMMILFISILCRGYAW